MESPQRFDFLIIGSGFGGSVSAYRLAEKGYRVAVLEKGKRFKKSDFPKTNWRVTKFLWAPLLRCFGIQQITFLKGVMVLHGSGVGGGSLVYANTLMKPEDKVFDDPHWPKGASWKEELAPHYETAKKMLGVTTNPILEESDLALKKLAGEMNSGSTFHPTEVGVFFGKPNVEVPDPYFGGKGPSRVGCTACGGCMVGCRVGAKNTLDMNYLYLAEKLGTEVFPELKAQKIIPQSDGSYVITTRKTTSWFPASGPTFQVGRVVVAAGVLGTNELLFKNKEVYRTLPNISDQLGDVVRTNGENLLGGTTFDSSKDFSKGIAIGSAFHPDEKTKIEAVRYPAGSSVMRMLAVPLTPNGNAVTRPLKMILGMFTNLLSTLRVLTVKDWARQTIILLVMQSSQNQMRLKKGFLGLKGQAKGDPLPTYLPVAQKSAQLLARDIHGFAQNVISEVLLNTTATAHILGGCCMGDSPQNGVIDKNHEVFGHPGLYICDGSVVPANLGVNPSLTISALAERFASKFNSK